MFYREMLLNITQVSMFGNAGFLKFHASVSKGFRASHCLYQVAKFGTGVMTATVSVRSLGGGLSKVLGFKSELHAEFLLPGLKSCLSFLWLSFLSYGMLAQEMQ